MFFYRPHLLLIGIIYFSVALFTFKWHYYFYYILIITTDEDAEDFLEGEDFSVVNNFL